MKSLHIAMLITLMGTSMTQLYGFKFTVHNYLDVPISVKLPLALELKNAKVITVPAKGENTYDTTFYGVCLATQNVQIAKKGGNFVATPLKNAIDENSYAAMMGEAKTNNGKVNTVSLREGMFDAFRNSINATCGHTNIEVIEDTNGTLHAVSGFAR